MTWRDRAACRPGQGLDPAWMDEHALPWQQTEALSYCARCPVIADCETEAVSIRATGMIWAGRMRTTRRPCATCGQPVRGVDSVYCSPVCRPKGEPEAPDVIPDGLCGYCLAVMPEYHGNPGQRPRYCGGDCRRRAANRRERERRRAAAAVAS